MPWLRYALLGVVMATIWLAFSLFSSTVGASAEEVEPADPAGVLAPESSIAESTAGADDPPEAAPAEEPPPPAASDVETPVAEDAPAAEPAPNVSAPAPEPAPANTPPGLTASPEQAITPPAAKPTEPGKPAAKPAETGKPAATPPVPTSAPAPANRNDAPPGLADMPAPPAATPIAKPEKPERPETNHPTDAAQAPTAPGPTPEPVDAPKNDIPPGLAGKPEQPTPTPAAEYPEFGTSDEPVHHHEGPNLPQSHPTGASAGPVAPGVATVGSPLGSGVSGPPSGSHLFAEGDAWAFGSIGGEHADAPNMAAGTIEPASGTPLGGSVNPAPAAGSGAGSGGAGSGGAGSSGAASGGAGTSGTSDATIASLELGALAAMVLHSADDELPSSPVYATDTTPD
ncbi:hypothetical protein GCM10009749_16320 [Agromyces neolithicus]|uniref:Meckel syndrome type 1 protein n=1 Tax=Agromyces neolithicus TaxID=269420 RepID=A0ABN2M6V5_9MICO